MYSHIVKTIFIITTIGLCLSACGTKTDSEEPSEIKEEEPEKKPEKTSEVISFAGQDFAFPIDMAVYHNPNTSVAVEGDDDCFYFEMKGGSEDVCVLRNDTLSENITDTDSASSFMKSYCLPEYYGAYDIAFADTQLIEPFYFQCSSATDKNDATWYIFTFIPKNTKQIYSVSFKCNNEEIICGENDVKLILSSLESYAGEDVGGDILWQFLNTYIELTKEPVETENTAYLVPELSDEQKVELMSDTYYHLNAKTGLYTLYVVEGEGEVYIDDSRFGSRSALMGYDSANAPSELDNVTLCQGGQIYTSPDLVIGILK